MTLFIKRLLTSLVLLIPMFVGCYVYAVVMFVGLPAGQMGAKSPGGVSEQQAFDEGRSMHQNYGSMVAIGSLIVAALGSFVLAFSGALPWCRPRTRRTRKRASAIVVV